MTSSSTLFPKIYPFNKGFYSLSGEARLSDLIRSVRADEMHHSEVNHSYADSLSNISSRKEAKGKKAA